MSARRYTKSDLALLAANGLDAPLPEPKPRKKRKNEESLSQIAVFRWWHRVHAIDFNLPEIVMHSVPNGGFRGIITATIMKREGQQRGVFDIKLNVARKGFHGLWLEMKAEKGQLSEAQLAFSKAMFDQNYLCAVSHSTEHAIQTIKEYLG